MTHSGEIEATGSAVPGGDSGFPLWLIIAIIALVGVGIGIAVVLTVSGKRKPTDESQAGNFGVTDAGTATPVVGADPAIGAATGPVMPAVEADPVINPEPVVEDAPVTDSENNGGDETPRA